MSSFHLQEATVADVHAALASGELTCTRLTKLYIDRIEAYNLKGPALRAILTVNPRALETAAEMDRAYKADSLSVFSSVWDGSASPSSPITWFGMRAMNVDPSPSVL